MRILSPGIRQRNLKLSLNEILALNGPQWTAAPVKIAVSFGVSGFQSLSQLAHPIEDADKAMYLGRQRVRGTKMPVDDYVESEPALSR